MRKSGFRTRSLSKNRSSKNIVASVLSAVYAMTRAIQWTCNHHWKHASKAHRKTILKRLTMIVAGGGAILLALLWYTLPNIDDPETMFAKQSTVILDRNGIELYRLFSEEDRTYITGDAINPLIKKATIAIEDQRYFERSSCVDFTSLARAVLSQILPGILVRSGGSTLPQQFAKNALVGRERSMLRKVRELLLSCKLQQRYTKEELLELYLNWIPYGQNAYGVEQAARTYFSKSAKDVTLAEAAVLAALPQRPSYFNPYGKHVRTTVQADIQQYLSENPQFTADNLKSSEYTIGLLGAVIGSGSDVLRIGGRSDQVLTNMRLQGMISEDEEKGAKDELLTMTFKKARPTIRAPHFVLEIEKQVKEILGVDDDVLEQGGFRIQTTLDWNIQEKAEKAVLSRKDDLATLYGVHNVAIFGLDPSTREVLTYVGNIDYRDEEHGGKIDMVKEPRQPGSSFKPFTYAGLFEAGYGPGSILYDVGTKFGTDQPQNFDGTFWGPISVRRSLAGSRNIPAVKAFFLGGGEEKLLSLTERLGVETPSRTKAELRAKNSDADFGWPLSIGAVETPLFEMVQGYSAFADGGTMKDITMIQSIADIHGNVLYTPPVKTPTRVLDSRIATMVTSILSDVNARPANDYWKSVLTVPGTQAAAKTGTSNKCLERSSSGDCTLRRPESVWTIGYSPSIAVGVWAGNANSSSLLEKADGLTVAAPIWKEVMIASLKANKNAITAFTESQGLARPLLSLLSGDLASSCTPPNLRASDLVFEENIPSEEDRSCKELEVDLVTGLLPSESCPKDARGKQSFLVLESEKKNRWPLWEQAVQEWGKKQDAFYRANDTHSGSLLPLPLAPTKPCDITLTPGRLDKPTLTVLRPRSGDTISAKGFIPEIEVVSKAPVQKVSFSLDETLMKEVSTLPVTERMVLPKDVSSGRHTLTVSVTDMYYNVVSETVSIMVGEDRKGPSISLTVPSRGTVGSTLPLTADVNDESGVDRVQLFVNNKLVTTKRVAPYTFDVILPGTPGEITIGITARDSSGNEETSEETIVVE